MLCWKKYFLIFLIISAFLCVTIECKGGRGGRSRSRSSGGGGSGGGDGDGGFSVTEYVLIIIGVITGLFIVGICCYTCSSDSSQDATSGTGGPDINPQAVYNPNTSPTNALSDSSQDATRGTGGPDINPQAVYIANTSPTNALVNGQSTYLETNNMSTNLDPPPYNEVLQGSQYSYPSTQYPAQPENYPLMSPSMHSDAQPYQLSQNAAWSVPSAPPDDTSYLSTQPSAPRL